MTKSLWPLALFLVLEACSTVQVPNIHPGITLPASGDGYQFGTLSHDEIRTPAAEWQQKLPRGIILFSDDWETLKETILENCISNNCSQSVGALDYLFQTIDQALKNLPTP